MVTGQSGVHALRSLIIRVKTKSDDRVASMITDRIGRHEVLLPINYNYTKICVIFGFFKIKTQEIPRFFFTCLASKNKPFKCAWAKTRTVLLYCPISIGNSMICSGIWHKYHE